MDREFKICRMPTVMHHWGIPRKSPLLYPYAFMVFVSLESGRTLVPSSANSAMVKKIRPFIDNELIKVLTGFRCSGKSVMLALIQEEIQKMGVSEEQIITLNFEDMRNAPLCNYKALHEYVSEKANQSGKKLYLFLDEIQEVDKWEKCINSFRVEFEIDIYITGSNAKMLSGELATYLAGRYVEFVIYPFSFAEFMELREEQDQAAAFVRYMKFGGMPFLHNLHYEWEPARQYLMELYNSVILKDIIKRNKIRDVDLLEKIISYVIMNIAKTFSATSISKYFKNEGRTVAPETVLNYISACESAFLFYRAKRQDLEGKKVLSVNEKYYMVDQGIREAVFGSNTKDIELVLENIVYMELLRRLSPSCAPLPLRCPAKCRHFAGALRTALG